MAAIFNQEYLVLENVHQVGNSNTKTIFTIDDDDRFVSHDVVALFTNTPIPETLNYIRDKRKNDVTLCNRTNLNADDIMELLEFICSTTYFTFDGKIMQQ